MPNDAYFLNPLKSKNHWFDKVSNKKNKNVSEIAFKSFEKTNFILILGQVYNDFAITSTKNKYKNSIGFYKDLIKEILENTTEDVVFKAHPYEDKKVKNGMKTTLEELQIFKLSLPINLQNRLYLVKNFSMQALFQSCKFTITLTSQAGLESVFYGKPIVTFGGAFYSYKNFSYDFSNIDCFIKAYCKKGSFELDSNMLFEYNSYMTHIFDNLVGVDEIEKCFEIFNYGDRSIYQKEQLNTSSSLVLDKPVQAKLVDKPVQAKLVVDKLAKNTINPHIRKEYSNNKKDYKRLYKKFRRDPKAFFLDSKFVLIRPLGKLFK